MTTEEKSISYPPLANASEVWMAILQGLAGASPVAFWGTKIGGGIGYEYREEWKSLAGDGLRVFAEPMHATFRAPYFVMHAYAHWWRAWLKLQTWSADDYDQAFSQGMNFRRYLSAWLWSVGVPQLNMTATDLEAVHAMTGSAPLPHPNLPLGYSELRHEYFSVTEIDKLPAKALDLETITAAFERSAL